MHSYLIPFPDFSNNLANSKISNPKVDPGSILTKNPHEEMVVMGYVSGPHGIRGQIKVVSCTEKSDGLLGYPVWWFGKQNAHWAAHRPEDCLVSGKHIIVKLKEYNDRLSVMALRGQQIAVPRSHLPPLPENGENGYYWSDLIGSNVFDLNGDLLGRVTGLLKTGANDALQIQGPEGKQELLIPFIDSVITRVNLSSKEITVDWGIDY